MKIHLGKVCTQSLESEDLLWKSESEGSLAKGVYLIVESKVSLGKGVYLVIRK